MTEKHQYLAMLEERWPEAELGERCVAFIDAHWSFWAHHADLLHLRNRLADGDDKSRFLRYRRSTSEPQINQLVWQMDGDPEDRNDVRYHAALVLLTSIERVATVMTTPGMVKFEGEPDESERWDAWRGQMRAQARILELTLVDMRAHSVRRRMTTQKV